MKESSQTLLQQANKAFREGNYSEAYTYYIKARERNPELDKIVDANIKLITNRKDFNSQKKINNDKKSKKEKAKLQDDYETIYRVIKNSNLFDPSFYLSKNPDVKKANIDPVEHYIKHGSDEDRNPSKLFNEKYYKDKYKEARSSEKNTLYYYETFGRKNKHSTLFGKTAVLLHVFYINQLKEILSKLNNIPNFDLHISCSSSILTQVKEITEKHNKKEVSFYEVDNIGYDIYPFLYILKKLDISKYDCFFKIHTKQGNANTDVRSNIWFDMLTNTTIGSKKGTKKILETFANKSAGLIGSADMYRSNLSHLYGNGENINNILMQDFGIFNPIKNWGFFAGSIFWFSSEIASLLSNLNMPVIASFDGKIEQKKGISSSIWHAYERIFGYLPALVNQSSYLTYSKNFNNDIYIKNSKDTTIPNGISLSEKYSIKCYSKIINDYKIIKNSDYFDHIFYEKQINHDNIDHIYHYLRYGLFELLDPNKDFNSFEYLCSYDGVKSNFLNPFVHYLCYGQKEGKLSTNSNKNYKNKKIDILATCWLGVEDPLLDVFFQLHESSKKSLMSLQIVTNKELVRFFKDKFCIDALYSSAIISLNSAYITIPNAWLSKKETNHNLEKLYEADHTWIKERKNFKKINLIYIHWKEYLLSHQVKHLLIWGNTAPMSQLFITLCQELSLEYTIIERGHFTGTILADSLGQFGFGLKQKQLEYNKSLLLSEEYKKERMQQISSWIDEEKSSAYTEKNQKKTGELKAILNKKRNKRIVLFLGANDLGSGMKDLNKTPRTNTWFKSSQDALNNVVDVLPDKFDDVLLVIKSHPSAKLEISDKLSSDNYIFANQTSIKDLIKTADVCITSISTVLAYCVAYGKPTLQFGITDSTNSKEIYDVWHPSVIASYLRDALDEQFLIEKNDNYSEYILNLFDSHLIRVNDEIPTKLGVDEFASHLFNRIYKSTDAYEYEIINGSPEVSKKLYEDITNRKRKTYDLSTIDKIDEKALPKIVIIIPVYDDLVGLRRNIERVVKYRDHNNNYDIVLVWDCGPNIETLEYCREASEKHGFDLIENTKNIGFSGTVNKGILKYKSHDVIVHNSDTIVHSDWALRMQASAYVDKEIGSVNPLSNNATLNNVPFPKGIPFPKDPISFVERIDSIAKQNLKTAIESPISHGFCVFIKRAVIDIIGLFDEHKFGKGHGEDNEFSMRLRSKGFKCVLSTNVFVGHDGSTSFKDDVMFWKLNGRKVMNEEFPFYMKEIKDFFDNDPISKERKVLEQEIHSFFNKPITLKDKELI